MSRDNKVSINAGRDVRIEALAVGDAAQAAAVHSAEAQKLAEHFLQIHSSFDALEAEGKLTAVEAKTLREEADDVQGVAQKALEDPAQKEALAVKLKRFAGSIQTFCSDRKEIFESLHHVAAMLALPLALAGFRVP